MIEIKDLALKMYPIPPDAPANDRRLLLAFGQIAGLAAAAIEQVGDAGSERQQ